MEAFWLNPLLPTKHKRYRTGLVCDGIEGHDLKKVVDDLFDEYGLSREGHAELGKWSLRQRYLAADGGRAKGSYYTDLSPPKQKHGIDANIVYGGVDRGLVHRLEDAFASTGCIKTL